MKQAIKQAIHAIEYSDYWARFFIYGILFVTMSMFIIFSNNEKVHALATLGLVPFILHIIINRP